MALSDASLGIYCAADNSGAVVIASVTTDQPACEAYLFDLDHPGPYVRLLTGLVSGQLALFTGLPTGRTYQVIFRDAPPPAPGLATAEAEAGACGALTPVPTWVNAASYRLDWQALATLRLEFTVPAGYADGGPLCAVYPVGTGGRLLASEAIYADYVIQPLPNEPVAIFSGLPLGTYAFHFFFGTVDLSHVLTGTVSPPVIGCRNPLALNFDPLATDGDDEALCELPPPPPRTAHFVFPAINPFHFVIAPEGMPDDITVFATPYNTSYCADVPSPAWSRPPWFIPVIIGDVYTIQFQSNYNQPHTVELLNLTTGAVAVAYTVENRLDLTAAATTYPVWLTADTDATKMRVFFHSPFLPEPWDAAQVVTLTSAGLGGVMDGPCLVDGLGTLPGGGAMYLLVNRPWAGGTARRLSAQLTSTRSAQDFTVCESTIDFNTVVEGHYRLRLTASDDEFGEVVAESEALYVAATQPNTLVTEWRNYDNAFGIYYETGISHRLRVPSTMFRSATGGARSLLRDSDNRLRKTGGAIWLTFEWDIYLVPKWVLEQLAAALEHDLLLLNRVRYVAESGMPEPEYYTRFTLASAKVKLELVGWMKRGNGDDIGGPLPGAGDTGIPGISVGDGLLVYTQTP